MTELFSGQFTFTPIKRVIFGPGSAPGRIASEMDELGTKKALIITDPEIDGSDMVDRMKKALGSKLAGVYANVGQHVPRHCVFEAADMVKGLVGRFSLMYQFGYTFLN